MQMASAAEMGEEGFVDSDGVKIHYVTMGKGPLVVMIHGFPDFWYTWREPVYLGRMLSRLQRVESFVRGPRERGNALTPAIERLLRRRIDGPAQESGG